MQAETVSLDEIIARDVFLRSLCHNRKMNSAQVVLLVCVLSAFLFWGVGGMASALYTGPGKPITAPDNLVFMVAWVLIFVPLIWGAYLWQSKSAPALIVGLLEGKSFGMPGSENGRNVARRAKKIFDSMLSRRVYFFAFVILLIFWGVEFTVSWPEQLSQQTEYWFDVGWYLPIHLLAWSLSLYPLFIFALRHITFVIGLRHIFLRHRVEVRPLDPDDCGGLGETGNFVKSSIRVAVGLGFIAVFFGFVVYANGSNVLRRPDVLSLFALYIAFVPFSLIVPVTSARAAMLRARDRVLAPLAQEFQETLFSLQQKIPQATGDFKEVNERLKEMQVYRETILRTYPTMPILLGALQQFSISAALPLITGIVSLILQII